MSRNKKIGFQALTAIFIIIIGIAGFKTLKAGKQEIEKQKPVITLPLVRTITVVTGPMDIVITGQGTVVPDREIQLVPQVDGRIVQVSENLVNGGRFAKGDLLLAIDPADYDIARTLAEARVREAESLFKIAQEESAAAINEWHRHNPDAPPPPLVAKTPQTDAARAKLAAERASLKAARLNLERTRLIAPFNGRVASKEIDPGQYVTPGQTLATLHGTDGAEIAIPLEDADLFWIDIPGFTTDSATGSAAEVRAVVAGEKITWQGRIVRTEGRIDLATRMHQVVVRVDAPYASLPPLAAGQFATVRIFGKTISRATVIPRAALHDGNIVWRVDPEEHRLWFQKVNIARRDYAGVILQDSLAHGDRIVTSPLKTVTHGMKVRFIAPSEAGAAQMNGENPS